MLTNIYIPRAFRWLCASTMAALLAYSVVGTAVQVRSLLQPGSDVASHRGVLERYEALLSKSELAHADTFSGTDSDMEFLEATIKAIMRSNGTTGFTPAQYVSRTEAELERCQQQTARP